MQKLQEYAKDNKTILKSAIWGIPRNSKKIGLSFLEQLLKTDLSSDPERAKFAMHRTHLKLAEYATDTERVIKLTMKRVASSSLKRVFL